MEQELKKRIVGACRKEGIDMIGFASKERFLSVSSDKNPFSIFPDGKTVILLGKRICRGSLRGVEQGTNFGDYSLFGANWLEDEFLALACYNMTRVIEDDGWEAVPVFPNPSELGPMGVPVAPGIPSPNVFPEFDYAAVACGLCGISYLGLPFSKEFGSRQRFHMIITDAELEGSPRMDGSVCDRWRKCADACPLGAISKTETEEIEICGKKMTVAKIDFAKCRECKNGACLNRFGKDLKPDRVAALCNRTCMCHLEENNLVDSLFENRFRTEKPWGIGSAKQSFAERDTESANVLGGVFSVNGDRRSK